jgi:hypothetical protein
VLAREPTERSLAQTLATAASTRGTTAHAPEALDDEPDPEPVPVPVPVPVPNPVPPTPLPIPAPALGISPARSPALA